MKNRFFFSPFMLMCGLIFFINEGLKAQSSAQAVPNPIWLQGKWNATWISCPETSLKDYNVFHFRKTFELKERSKHFIINVSGDNRYRLYVNGVEVCHGPARGDLANWRFETIDIAEHLHEGQNVLAAVVWNFGEYSHFAQMSFKTAFILQGNTAAEEMVNTGNSWKVYQSKAYKIPSGRPSKSVVGPGDEVDGALYPFDWEKIEYDDSTWLPPRSLGAGIPHGKFSAWDWMLVPRNIPFMESSLLRIPEVERTENIKVHADFLKGTAPLYIPAGKKVKVLLDQTALTTAYPVLKVSGGKGSRITIDYAEAMVDKNGNKGNRNEVKGKYIDSDYRDVFKPDGENNRKFEPLWFRTYRYIELTIETAGYPLTINDLYGNFTAYPLEEKGYFKSDNPLLASIWNVGWHTARLCAGEIYFDCPYYEQLQYVGDTRIQSLISLYVAGDDRLMRNAIDLFRQSMTPEGLTQSRYPSSQPQIIPPFSLFWIAMVHDFWMHRDDLAFTEKQLNAVENTLNWYEKHVDTDGILKPMDWWNFVDWSFGPFNSQKPIGGVPPGGMDGQSSILTLQYVYALQQAADLFQAFNHPLKAQQYRKQAGHLLEKTYALCWSTEKGLLADTPEKTSFSQHANIMGLLTGMFDDKDPKSVMNNLLIKKDVVQATYYFRFYLHRALEKIGMADDYLKHLQPWEEMLGLGLTTFAERPEPTRSDCHAWSASPNYDLLSLVSGIKPGSPGFKTVHISPNLGSLPYIEASVPHQKGAIKINLKKKGKTGISGVVQLPENLSGVFEWKGKIIKLNPGTQNIDL